MLRKKLAKRFIQLQQKDPLPKEQNTWGQVHLKIPQATHLHFHFQNRRCHHRPGPTFNQSQMHVPRHVGRRRLFSHSIAVGCGTTDFINPMCRNVAIDEQM